MNIEIENMTINITPELAADHTAFMNKSSAEPSENPTLEWSHTLLNGEEVSLEGAEKACRELGEGWRLPTRRELESILDLSRHDPAIDTDKFPDTKSAWYWTSTPTAWNTSAAWIVDFGDGYVNSNHRNNEACVRAVRASQ